MSSLHRRLKGAKTRQHDHSNSCKSVSRGFLIVYCCVVVDMVLSWCFVFCFFGVFCSVFVIVVLLFWFDLICLDLILAVLACFVCLFFARFFLCLCVFVTLAVLMEPRTEKSAQALSTFPCKQPNSPTNSQQARSSNATFVVLRNSHTALPFAPPLPTYSCHCLIFVCLVALHCTPNRNSCCLLAYPPACQRLKKGVALCSFPFLFFLMHMFSMCFSCSLIFTLLLPSILFFLFARYTEELKPFSLLFCLDRKSVV